MNTIFKKSLVALALSAAAMSAQAVTVAVTPTQLSFEGAANETSIALPTFTATVGTGVEYAAGDIITITIAGAKIAAAANPSMAFTAHAGQVGDTATVTFLSKSDTEIKFRIGSVTEGGAVEAGLTALGAFALTGVTLDKASVLATATNKVTVKYAAATGIGSIPIDTAATAGADTGTAIEVKEQFTATVSRKLNAVVDVEQDRKLFTSVTDTPAIPLDSTVKDTLAISLTDPVLTTQGVAASVAYTIGGDFSWMDADKNGAVSTAELNTAFGYALSAAADAPEDDTSGQATINAAMNEIKVLITGVSAGAKLLDAKHSFVFTVPGAGATKPVLNKQDFTVAAVVNYTPATGSATTKTVVASSAANAGVWALNGSTVVVPYMVHQYGKFSSIINVHNAGSKEGAMALDIWDDNGNVVVTNYAAGTSKPGAVSSVATAAVNALISKNYNLNNTTKYSVRVVTNVPAKDITVNSAYADVSGATVTRTPVSNDSAVQNKGL